MAARNRTGERGGTLVMTALLLVVLLGFAALAVDLGVLYTARTSAQHAADAAALAGAAEFGSACYTDPSGSTCTGYNVVTAAQNASIAVAAQNSVVGTPVSISAGDVTVDTANLRVTVRVARTGANGVPTFFAKVLKSGLADIRAQATAEAGQSTPGNPGASSSMCLKPIFLPNTIMAQPPLVATAETETQACANGHKIFSSSNQVTPWATSGFGQISPYTVKPNSPPGAQPGIFYALNFGPDLNTNNGAQTYQCTLANCINACGTPTRNILSCGANQSISVFDIKTGNMVGPTVAGVKSMIGNSPQNYSPSTFMQNPKQIAVAAVWDDCDPSQQLTTGTNQNVKVIGFVQIYVDGADNKTGVSAHILGQATCASINDGDETGTGGIGSNTGGIPIKLVQSN